MCTLCFRYMQIYPEGASVCCPAWNKAGIVPFNGRTLKEIWTCEEFEKGRKAITNYNSGEFCLNACPYYRGVEEAGTVVEKVPTRIMVSFDETCNIRCQTCRKEIIVSNQEKVKKMFEDLEESFGQTLEALEISGSGDPIASKVSREWIQGLTQDRFPKLKQIYLQTNGLLLTEEFYRNLSDFVKSRLSKIIISIDAATKETYEKIRRGGNWEKLQTNLQFLSKEWNKPIAFCFVVQRDNYTEIVDFYQKMSQQFPKAQILYEMVAHWGEDRCSLEDFNRMNVAEDTTKEVRKELRRQLNSVLGKQKVILQGEVPRALSQEVLV